MWSSGRRVLQELLSQPAVRSFSRTPVQNTVVVERWWQVPLSKEGSPPRLHPRRHRIYKMVEDTQRAPEKRMELILAQTVPKLGGRGSTVFVKKSIGRNKLLAQGLAVYPSPENKAMFAEELRLMREGRKEDRIQSYTGKLTVEYLKQSKLVINKAKSEEFQLNKDVVVRQLLRKLGLVVPLHALTLPFEPIKEVGDYWCEVTVNGIDTVRIPMSLVPYEDPSAKYQRQLKMQRRQQEEQEAANMSEAMEEQEEDIIPVKATPEATVNMEADKVSDSGVAEAAASAEQKTTTETSQDTTAPPSGEQKKD